MTAPRSLWLRRPRLIPGERTGDARKERLSSRPIEIYVTLVALAALLVLFVPAPTWPLADWGGPLIILFIFAVVAELNVVGGGQSGGVDAPLTPAPHIALILLVPHPYAALAIGASVAIEQLSSRQPPIKVIFNVTCLILTASLASLVAWNIALPWRDVTTNYALTTHVLFAAISANLIYYLLNAILAAAAIAIASRRSFIYLLEENTRPNFLFDLEVRTTGTLFAIMWIFQPIWTILLLVIAAGLSRFWEHIWRIQNETSLAVRNFAKTIDARDTTTAAHSNRVAEYAVMLAQSLHLREELIVLIEQAASVHDLGKIGVPDRVLLKGGPLNKREWGLMQLHTTVGATLLDGFSQFRQGTSIVRHHHESYDGSGYPDGLAGEAIPLGARVVAVADAFDAMTSHRPYRQALPIEEALKRLRAGAGTQWDAAIVARFVALVESGEITLNPTAIATVPVAYEDEDFSETTST